ncbi:MAG: hypothetical protein HYU99_08405 [Deltaproteobacteria bacterium]|nr:hypothetical protein [Deltaproteobacteria bacterium]
MKEAKLIIFIGLAVIFFGWFGIRPTLVRSLCQKFAYDAKLQEIKTAGRYYMLNFDIQLKCEGEKASQVSYPPGCLDKLEKIKCILGKGTEGIDCGRRSCLVLNLSPPECYYPEVVSQEEWNEKGWRNNFLEGKRELYKEAFSSWDTSTNRNKAEQSYNLCVRRWGLESH